MQTEGTIHLHSHGEQDASKRLVSRLDSCVIKGISTFRVYMLCLNYIRLMVEYVVVLLFIGLIRSSSIEVIT